MGTRGLIGVVADGVFKGTYNHFDSYPSGLGVELAKQVAMMRKNLPLWRDRAKALMLVGENTKPAPADKRRWKPYTDLKVSERSTADWYCLTHGAQGKLNLILEIGQAIDSREFVRDSLFCEYAYVVDFDREVLVCLQGFNKASGAEAPFDWCRHTELPTPPYPGADVYWGCSLVAEIPLADVSPEAVLKAYGEPACEEPIDTSDIPAVGEEWFEKAQLKLPTEP